MKKLFITPIILLSLFLAGCGYEKPADQVCFQENCYHITIASTTEEQQTGLMNTLFLPEDEGMLFDFVQQKKHSIWMLNMDFPIDIIWLDKDKKVVYMEQNAQPCSGVNDCPLYSPNENSKYVLEINTNQISTIGLQVGDQLEFRFASAND